MKSKKPNSNKTGWNPYNKNIGHSNPTSSKENPSVSQRTRETASNISMSVDSPAMNIPTNPVNSGALRVSSPSLSSPSPQPPATMQPAGVDVSVARQPAGSNVPTPQGHV